MSDTTNADSGTGQQEAATPASARVRQQVEDALELAYFIVSTGVKTSDGQPLPIASVTTIQETAAKLGLLDVDCGEVAAGTISVDDWKKFEQAYYELAIVMSPVTAETLRDTRDTARPRGHYASFWLEMRDFFFGYSPAQRFTRRLWFMALAFAIFVVWAEWRVGQLGLKKDADSVDAGRALLESLIPWAYGGLGACAYMLRSAHYFIYQRSFDSRRTPEYFNRILLGSISGGAIILFSQYLAGGDDGTVAHFGSAALGFIAGYSTDFLFNTIERIVTAIFPKVAVETVPTNSSQARNPPKRRPLDGKVNPEDPPVDDTDPDADKDKGKGKRHVAARPPHG